MLVDEQPIEWATAARLGARGDPPPRRAAVAAPRRSINVNFPTCRAEPGQGHRRRGARAAQDRRQSRASASIRAAGAYYWIGPMREEEAGATPRPARHRSRRRRRRQGRRRRRSISTSPTRAALAALKQGVPVNAPNEKVARLVMELRGGGDPRRSRARARSSACRASCSCRRPSPIRPTRTSRCRSATARPSASRLSSR